MISIGLGKIFGQKDILVPEGFKVCATSLLVCTVAINILSLGLPVMTLQVYDRILPNPGTGTLPVLIVGVCLAIVLEALLRLCRANLIARAGASYEHLMACRAMKCILNAELSKFGSHGVGENLHRVASVGKLKDFYNGYALTTAAELAFVPLFFILIAYIAGYLVILPMIILTLFTVVSVWKGYCLRAALKNREKADDRRFNFLIETLGGIHTVKALALEKFFERRYETLEEYSCYENYNVTQETASSFNIGAIFSHLMVASVISVGAVFVLNGLLTTGGLIATLLLSGRMMQPVQKALSLWMKYQDYVLASEKTVEVLSTPQRIVVPRVNNHQILPEGMLSIKDMSFRHNDSSSWILRDINLDIKRGETILLSNGHGEEKLALLNLMSGIYSPTQGEIKVDGENINSYTPDILARHVGYVTAQSVIFRGTIRDNITSFGQAQEAQAREVAALLGVDKDVAKLPGGFDTFLSGSNSDSVSPGLLQRISIVRVLAAKPRLIIFDNADRALDKEGYGMIFSLLARLKGKASMILVSDDRNICSLADSRYSLENGRLVEIQDSTVRTNIRPYKELRL